MKIGVDAVLLGAWADVSGSRRILDAGTGCGVIAMMCAQRNADALVEAIDIDAASVEEANANFSLSPWPERLKARLEDFSAISRCDYDLIVSNPPYFNSGITDPDTPRLVARHQGTLSPAELIKRGSLHLAQSGRLAMIVPADQHRELVDVARRAGLFTRRSCLVRGHAGAPAKRILLEFSRLPVAAPEERELILETAPNVPTEEYRTLCKDFYLKF